MIQVEGYKAFRGAMLVTPVNEHIAPYKLCGDFLYKPDTDCWYHGGVSFPAEICTVLKEDYHGENH